MAIQTPKGLGRGLDALLAGGDDTAPATPARCRRSRSIACGRGKYQPRTRMDEASLDELAASIREQGVMQPILVRPRRRRPLRDHRRRAALARRAARGPHARCRRWCESVPDQRGAGAWR